MRFINLLDTVDSIQLCILGVFHNNLTIHINCVIGVHTPMIGYVLATTNRPYMVFTYMGSTTI